MIATRISAPGSYIALFFVLNKRFSFDYSGGMQTANSAYSVSTRLHTVQYSVPSKSVDYVFPNLVMQIRIFRV